MARGSRPGKVQEWSDRLTRFAETSLTVAEFCKAEGVSQQSFYQWKRKLRQSGVARSPRSRFQAVRVSPVKIPSGPTTIRLGKGIRIELGGDLPVVERVVKQVLDVVVDADRHPATTPRKSK